MRLKDDDEVAAAQEGAKLRQQGVFVNIMNIDMADPRNAQAIPCAKIGKSDNER